MCHGFCHPTWLLFKLFIREFWWKLWLKKKSVGEAKRKANKNHSTAFLTSHLMPIKIQMQIYLRHYVRSGYPVSRAWCARRYNFWRESWFLRRGEKPENLGTNPRGQIEINQSQPNHDNESYETLTFLEFLLLERPYDNWVQISTY